MRSSLELLKHSNSINEFSRDLFPSKEWVFLLNNDFLLPLLGGRTFWFPPEQGTGRSKLDWGPGLERSLLLMQWNPYRSHTLFLNESIAIGKEMWQPNFGWLLTRQSSNSFRSSRNNRKEAKRLRAQRSEREKKDTLLLRVRESPIILILFPWWVHCMSKQKAQLRGQDNRAKGGLNFPSWNWPRAGSSLEHASYTCAGATVKSPPPNWALVWV